MTRNKKAAAFAVLAVLLWSTVATAFEIALETMTPLDLLIASCFWSALALGLLVFKGAGFSGFLIRRQDLLRYLAGALLNPLFYYLILFKSYALLPAQIAQPLNYTWPLMLVLLSAPILKKRIDLRDMAALSICFLGVVVISRGGRSFPAGSVPPFGISLALFSSVVWALYWLSGRMHRGSEEARLFWNFALALPLLLLIRLFAGAAPFPPIDMHLILSSAWIGLFEMGLTFYFWGRALALSSHPAAVSHLVYLSPFLSLFWISLVLGEKIRGTTIIGLAIIVTGILAKELFNKRDSREL